MTTTTTLKETIIENVENNKDKYLETSHAIHAKPEIGNEEYFACETLTALLENEGFTVEIGVAGHETSFVATYKSDKEGPNISFLAEYDALPGLGHACGHNIIGTTSVAAGIALSKAVRETGGTVTVLGTPAEEGGENGSAKGSFVKHGYLENVDAALMIHPYNKNTRTGNSLAVDPLDFEFRGQAAHAAASPEDGINALDGVIQLFNGVNALRQHVTDDVRIHGIITHGGDAPNIVPDYAKARFYIRAAERETCNEVTEKVKRIAEGAALSTGTTHRVIKIQNEVDNFKLNDRFDELFQKQWESLGEPFDPENTKGLGSTDAGNVSQVVPTIHPFLKIGPEDLVVHTDAFREAAKSEQGDHALIQGAKALALTGLELLTNHEALKEIQYEFRTKTKG
ncbi:M20 family metallopeptidase [Bacillus shivajii]|uniref:M20 family metallopeptidase n=1 Tax=Bacillus shivajii TaxID=1983719 RepID=UPI001CFBC2E6|nr:M20 family metallopeptidase [Bacillus shivajii]UCZ53989.1 M20 family metallopeptidase [Bacillus shivajii]